MTVNRIPWKCFTFGSAPSKARITDTFAHHTKSAARVQDQARSFPYSRRQARPDARPSAGGFARFRTGRCQRHRRLCKLWCEKEV